MTRQASDRAFTTAWIGQFVSFIGFEIVGFGAGVWVYLQTRSILLFALTVFCNVLPLALVPRLAQMSIVREHPRWGMFLGEAGAGLATVALAVACLAGKLEIWHVYVARLMIASSAATQRESLTSFIKRTVAPERHARATSMVEVGRVIGMIVSPPLGAWVITQFELPVTFSVGAATYLFSLVALAMAPASPDESKSTEAAVDLEASRRNRKLAWHYVMTRPGLFGLVAFFAFTNLVMGTVSVLLTPLVVGFSSVLTLGFVASAAGVGVLAGTLSANAWRGPKQRVHGIFALALVQGVFLILGGLVPTTPIITLVTLLFLFCLPMMVTSAQGIWKTKVPSNLEKDVLAVREAVAWSSLLVGYLVAGPLVEGVFQPLANSIHSGSAANGIPLLIAGSGALILMVTLVGYAHPRLRRVEQELPDAPVTA